MCAALEVSESGYYAWVGRTPSEGEKRRGELVAAIRSIHAEVKGRYGSPRMAAELNATALLLAEGQFLDIDLQQGQTPVTLEAYETMITRKTGVLFACACRLGAMAASASPAQRDAYAAYGLELG